MAKPKPQKPNETQRRYSPPAWGYKYVLAVLDPEIRPTKTARCEAIGIDRTTLWTAEKDAQFVEWFQQQILLQMHDAHEVRTALVRKCLSGDVEAIRLYLEKYGNYVPTTRTILDGLGDPSQLSDKQLADIAGIL